MLVDGRLRPVLAGRRLAVLLAVVEYRELHGYPPSISDVADRVGVCRSGVHAHLARLRRDGYLTWTPGHPRTFRPLLTPIPTRRTR